MKTKLLAVAAVLLALVCAWQWRELTAAKKQLADSQRTARAETETREAQEHKTLALEQKQSRLNDEVANLSDLVAAFRAAEAKSSSNVAAQSQPAPRPAGPDADLPTGQGGGLFSKGMSGMLAQMMKNPAMKDMMRAQQKSVMSLMYAGIAKDLNLTPEQNDKLTELLLDQQMKSLEHTQSLFSKDGNASTALVAAGIGNDQKQSDEDVKALLGEEKFAQYQEYKKTLGERMQLNLFQQQLDGGPSPLADDQLKQLIAVIREEHEKAPPAISEGFKQDPANLEKMFGADPLEKQMAWQEQMNQKVLDRAGQILSPEQLKAYADFQSQQLNLQKLGMKMAREMFGTKDPAGDVKTQDAPPK